MKSKTHIIVLRMKEIIYTALFLIFAVILILLLIFMFRGTKKSASPSSRSTANTGDSTADTARDTAAVFIPGMYTTSLVLGDNTVDIAVTTDSAKITGVSIIQLEESVAVMYPLLNTSLQDISAQLVSGTPLEHIDTAADSRYTYQLLTNAIRQALSKAQIEQ